MFMSAASKTAMKALNENVLEMLSFDLPKIIGYDQKASGFD